MLSNENDDQSFMNNLSAALLLSNLQSAQAVRKAQTKSQTDSDPVGISEPSQTSPHPELLPVTLEHFSQFCTLHAAQNRHTQCN